MRTLAALVLTAALVIPATAQPPRQPGGGGFRMGGGGAMMLGIPKVQEELKLTDEQKEKIKEYTEKAGAELREAFSGGGGDREKMAEIMKSMTEKGDKFVKETLTADQNKRLAQITLQQGGLFAAIANPETAKKLSITDEQKDKIQEISATMRKDSQELMQGGGFRDPETQKKLQLLRKEATEDAMKVLTDDQKKTWTELTGAPFEMPAMGGFGGQGKGKGKGKGKGTPDKKKDGDLI